MKDTRHSSSITVKTGIDMICFIDYAALKAKRKSTSATFNTALKKGKYVIIDITSVSVFEHISFKERDIPKNIKVIQNFVEHSFFPINVEKDIPKVLSLPDFSDTIPVTFNITFLAELDEQLLSEHSLTKCLSLSFTSKSARILKNTLKFPDINKTLSKYPDECALFTEILVRKHEPHYNLSQLSFKSSQPTLRSLN